MSSVLMIVKIIMQAQLKHELRFFQAALISKGGGAIGEGMKMQTYFNILTDLSRCFHRLPLGKLTKRLFVIRPSQCHHNYQMHALGGLIHRWTYPPPG